MDPEVQGDILKALDWLRAKGIAKASSSTRISAEGLIGVLNSTNKITLVEVNSETDFVSRNADFQIFVSQVASTAHNSPIEGDVSSAALHDMSVSPVVGSSSAPSIRHLLGDITTAIRENIVVRRAENISVSGSGATCIASYVHGKLALASDISSMKNLELGREASVVSLSLSPPITLPDAARATLEHTARRLCMHVVAAKPLYLSPEEVPQDVVSSETAIYKEQTLSAPLKNPSMADKIVAGKVSKRLAEISLTGQVHMAVEGGPVIEKHLAAVAKELSVLCQSPSPLSLRITGFRRWGLGNSTP